MTKVLILAAMAAVSLACANRAEEDVGAAPDQGDTTAVTHAIDTTRTGPPGVAGRPGDATITTDSVGLDTLPAGTPETTDTMAPWTSTPQDTLGPQDTGERDTKMQGDSEMMHGDSARTNHPVPDTTAAQ